MEASVQPRDKGRFFVFLWGLELVCIVVIGAVFYIQWAWDLPRCSLCLWQRVPYFIVFLLLAPMALFAVLHKNPHRLMLCCLAMVLLWIAGGLLGAYHAGLEWGFWQDVGLCSGDGGVLLSGDFSAFSEALEGSPDAASPCAVDSWRLMGISLAGYNVVISGFCAILSYWIYRAGQSAIAA